MEDRYARSDLYIYKICLFQGKYKLRKLKRLEENIEMFEQQYSKWRKLIKQ